MMESRDWHIQATRCRRLIQVLQNQVYDYRTKKRVSGAEFRHESFEKKHNRLNEMIENLSRALRRVEECPEQYKLSKSDVICRKKILQRMQIDKKSMINAYLNAPSYSIEQTSITGSKNYSSIPPMSKMGTFEEQQSVLRAQDSAIVDVEKSVSMILSASRAIHEETEIHNAKLDDLHNKVERNHLNTTNNTAHIQKVRASASNGRLYLMIFVLSGVLGFLIVFQDTLKNPLASSST